MYDPLGFPQLFGEPKQVHPPQFLLVIIKGCPFIQEPDPRTPGSRSVYRLTSEVMKKWTQLLGLTI